MSKSVTCNHGYTFKYKKIENEKLKNQKNKSVTWLHFLYKSQYLRVLWRFKSVTTGYTLVTLLLNIKTSININLLTISYLYFYSFFSPRLHFFVMSY